MKELKTLKKIQRYKVGNYADDGDDPDLRFIECNNGEVVKIEELRQEGIKHIKKLQKNWNTLIEEGNNPKEDFRYYLFDKIEHQIEFIKYFFNITKEDLK